MLKFDISDHSKIEEFIENVSSQLVGLDVLVNNAGITMDNLSLRMKNEEWKKVIDVNLSSTFYLCKYAIKKMLKNKYGRIVNITSIVGHTGNLDSKTGKEIMDIFLKLNQEGQTIVVITHEKDVANQTTKTG